MNDLSLAKVLRWLVYATALVPLIIFSQYMSPFHFGKVVILRSIVEVMAVLYIILVLRDRSYLPKSHPITWAFVAFTAAFTLTTITSVAHLQSFWGTLERMGGLWTFWHYLVFYIITLSVLRTRKDWEMLLNIMVGVGLASAVYGFLQKTSWSLILGSGGRDRIFGTLGNPALFAGYQILVAYLALTLGMLSRTSKNWRIGYWSASALMFIAAISTAVRGSLLGIVVGTVTGLLLYNILSRTPRAKKALIGGIAAVVVFFFLAILLRQTPLVQNSAYLRRITDFSSQTFTVKTRFWAWSAGFKGWAESPRTVLVGWGPENFNIPFSKYFNPKFFTGPGAETFFDRAHNMFVEVLVTMGLLGELAYLAIFGALFWTLKKFLKEPGDKRMLGIGFIALTVAYIIHNCFIFDTSANFLTFFMLLAYVVHVSQHGMDAVPSSFASDTPKAHGVTAGQLAVGGVLSLVAILTIYNTNVRSVNANYAITRAIIYGWQKNFPDAVKKYREAIDADTPGRYEFRHRFSQYIQEVSVSTDASKIPNFNDVILKAIDDVQNNISENPRDYLPYLYISRLYATLGHSDPKSEYNQKALEYATQALQISPTFVSTYYVISQAYLNIKDYDKASEWFQKAVALNPDVGISYWYLSQVDLQRGNPKGAVAYVNQALEHGYALTDSDTQKLINLYIQLGDIKSIVAIYEQLVKSFPDKPQYWPPLAAAYAQDGRTQDAINATRKALELNPNDAAFRKQAEAFLKQLGAKL